MPTLYVVMPVYNEGPTLQEILTRVLNAPLPEGWRVAVTMVDDGSAPAAASAAAAIAARAAANGAPVEFDAHPHNRGKGAALMTGFDRVLARACDGNDVNDVNDVNDGKVGDAVLVQDADLEYDPADYPALLSALVNALQQRTTPGKKHGHTRGQSAAVFGNRWANGEFRTGTYRRVHAAANRTLTGFSNMLTGLHVRDMECCYKLIPVALLRQIRPWLSEERFGIEPQLAAALARAGATVAEVPVTYSPRKFAEGKKIRWTDGVHALVVITRERLRRTPPRPAK